MPESTLENTTQEPARERVPEARENEVLGAVEGGWRAPVVAGRHAVDRVDDETGRFDHEAKLTRGETGRPEVELALASAGVAQCRPLVVDAGGRVEGLGGLEMPDDEVGREGGTREPSTRT